MSTKNANTPSDVDIMMFLDGELSGSEAQAVQAYLARDEQAAHKAEALEQVGAFVRGNIELEADDAEAKLAALWDGIDQGINTNGLSKAVEAESAAERAEERATQALVQNAGWMSGWQSHIATGALVAVAVAVLMYTMRPASAPQEQVATGRAPIRALPAPPVAMAVDLKSQAPEVELLEVYGGSGVIMTVAGDAADDQDGSSAVIWISNDTDVVEDPI